MSYHYFGSPLLSMLNSAIDKAKKIFEYRLCWKGFIMMVTLYLNSHKDANMPYVPSKKERKVKIDKCRNHYFRFEI